MSNHVSTDTVRDTARGKWSSILAALAPGLSPALQRIGRHVSCPVHGGKDGFRLFRDADESGGGICATCGEYPDGFGLLMWLNGWSFIETKQAVVDYLGLEPGTERLTPPRRRQPPVVQEQSEEETQKRRDKLTAVWKAAKPDPVLITNYLKSRGLFVAVTLVAPDALRLHPELPHYHEEQLLGTFPAMVARVQSSDGTGVTVHRTWLAQNGEGKAPVPSAKKLMTPIRDGATLGAAIRLMDPSDTLGLSEGIETALAVSEACKLEAFDLPVWATVTAGGMEAVHIPETVRRVEIWADNDASGRGQDAAQILAQRMHEAGKQVYVFLPPTAGKDWLDVLNEQGHEAIWRARMQGERWAPPGSQPSEPAAVAPNDDLEFLDIPAIKALQPPSWLIQNYLPKRSLCVLYGPSGGGKSFQAIDWGLSVATGRRWLTSAVSAGPVIYLAGEGAAGLGARIEAWEHDRMVKDTGRVPFTATKKTIRLMERSAVIRFIEKAQAKAPALVIIDTLARAMGGADENSTRDMNTAIEHADMIKESLGCTVLIVHHTNKGGLVERGSGALRGAADTMIGLSPEGDAIQLLVDKQKDSVAADPLQLRLCPVLFSGSCVLNLAEFSEGTGELTKDQRQALRALSYYRFAGAGRKDWEAASELRPGLFAAAEHALVTRALVKEPQKDDRPKRYRLTAEGDAALR